MKIVSTLKEQKKLFCKDLGKWYAQYHRQLPWRDNPSLYKTILSEFMLQQTQVETVLPYFKSWLEIFPDIKTLALADHDQVMKQWEGLGYYSRARNLHLLAKQLVQLPSIPQDPASWIQFPGVGPYTSAAITSISYNHPIAVVDGNVIRILSRLTGDDTLFSDNTKAVKHFDSLAQYLLDKEDPGTHNQAMMELGATVCFKHNPLCTICPVRHYCVAAQYGNPDQYPNLKRKATEKKVIHRAWLKNNHGIALTQIPKTAKRLANIWEFLDLATINQTPNADSLIFKKKRGISNQIIEEYFYDINENHPMHASCLAHPHIQWVSWETLETITLSGPHRRWLKDLKALDT